MITEVQLICGVRMYAMRLTYGDHQAMRHGYWDKACGTEAETFTYTLDNSEWIESVEVYYDETFVNSATFITNKRRRGMCGTITSGEYFVESGRRLEYISSVTGCWFDQLQFHWAL